MNLIRNGTDLFFIESGIVESGSNSSVKIGFSKQGKKIKIDGNPLQQSSEYLKTYFSLVFSPDNLSAFKSGPGVRRYFLDRLLCRVNPRYFEELKKFKRIQLQKNTLLKSGSAKNMEVWNQLLAENIKWLCTERRQCITIINDIFSEFPFFGQDSVCKLGYYPSVSEDKMTQEELVTFLMSKKERELKYGFMVYGPHRDNLDFVSVAGTPGHTFFSQGEYRTAFLNLIFSANRILKNNQVPDAVILLDDVFSELDKRHIDQINTILTDLSNQIFITGVTKSDVSDAAFYKISDQSLQAE